MHERVRAEELQAVEHRHALGFVCLTLGDFEVTL